MEWDREEKKGRQRERGRDKGRKYETEKCHDMHISPGFSGGDLRDQYCR